MQLDLFNLFTSVCFNIFNTGAIFDRLKMLYNKRPTITGYECDIIDYTDSEVGGACVCRYNIYI